MRIPLFLSAMWFVFACGLAEPLWAGPLEEARALEAQADEHRRAQRLDDSERLLRQAITIRERHQGSNAPALARPLVDLALSIKNRERDTERARLLLRAETILTAHPGADDLTLAFVLLLRARMLRDQGKTQAASALGWRALEVQERESGPNNRLVVIYLQELITAMLNTARYARAEPLLRRAISILDGTDDPASEKALLMVRLLDGLSLSLVEQKRYKKAVPVLERAATIAGTLSDRAPWWKQRFLARSAEVFLQTGDVANAKHMLSAAMETALKAYKEDSIVVARLLRQAGRIALESGKLNDAKKFLSRALSSLKNRFGDDHLEVVETQILHGTAVNRLLPKSGAIPHGFPGPDAIEALKRHATRSAGGRTAEDHKTRRKVRELAGMMIEMVTGTGHLGFLDVWLFDIAQLAHVASAGKAIADMAARFASGDGRLAELVRARQDAVARWKTLDQVLSTETGEEQDQTAAIAETRTRLSALAQRITEIDATLIREFPNYAELADLGFTDWKNLALKENELLLFYMIGEKASALWFFSGGRRALARRLVPIGREELEVNIAELRSGLDSSDMQSLADLPDFDLALAHKLYTKLLGSVALDLNYFRNQSSGKLKHLIIVPDGPLASLPFNLLVTEKPAQKKPGFNAYRKAAWLNKQFAISVLPSVSALKALRTVAKPAGGKRAFLGIGDPLLRDHPKAAGTAGTESTRSARRSTRSAWASWSRGSTRRVDVATLFRRGELADVDAVRNLAPLPDTADELGALAEAMGVGAENLYLRERASEPVVRADIPLSDYRIIAFATHGLMAGDLAGASGPALVLTPPEKASPGDDGLLSAGEIAQLDLDADWVILSACNTAAADGSPNAQGFSGLAKAFFYAGSRSLLVSHWPVFSDAAVRLTTGMMQRLAEDPSLSRADALRHAEQALMNDPDNPHFAHPIFWAPFTVVGEGGRIGLQGAK